MACLFLLVLFICTSFSHFAGGGACDGTPIKTVNVDAFSHGYLIYSCAYYGGGSPNPSINFSNGGTATLVYVARYNNGQQPSLQTNKDIFVYELKDVGTGTITCSQIHQFSFVVMW